MAYQPKENSGSLFKNDRKEKDTHPDYKGSCIIGGVEYWLSAWIKEVPQKGKFMSLAFTVKEQVAPAPPQREQQPMTNPKKPTSPFDDMDDDLIPF